MTTTTTTKTASVGKARFQASLTNGGKVYWSAPIVKIVDGIAYVRHPERARTFPFSPVAAPGLYRYPVERLHIEAK